MLGQEDDPASCWGVEAYFQGRLLLNFHKLPTRTSFGMFPFSEHLKMLKVLCILCIIIIYVHIFMYVHLNYGFPLHECIIHKCVGKFQNLQGWKTSILEGDPSLRLTFEDTWQLTHLQ